MKFKREENIKTEKAQYVVLNCLANVEVSFVKNPFTPLTLPAKLP